MKTISRLNTKFRGRGGCFPKKKILAAAFAAFFLFTIIFNQIFFYIFSRPLFYILKPFLEIRNNTADWWQKIKTGFNDKEKLWQENEILREKMAEMETKIAFFEILEKENNVFKSMFSAGEKQNFILGSIIFRPPKTAYDVLIIDAGERNGAKEGMTVTAFGKILIGYAVDVFPGESKVKLISSFGEETNALLEFSGAPVIVIGKGGENFEIMLPKAVSINVGERIIAMGKNPLLIGIAEKIEYQPTDPYQRIFLRLPVNIQHLSHVFLLKK